jgi:hypothetical protein
VATLLGATLLRQSSSPVLAKPTIKARATTTDSCFPGGTTCRPGKGTNTSRCDFAFSTVLHNKDVRGANLSQSNFVGADLRGADLRGTNLSGSCFVSADLTGARLGASVNLHDAIFCNTTLPDGRIDNSGCEGTTPCCHQRVQDCPDSHFDCYIVDTSGVCDVVVGSVSAGTCWSFPTCCPCQHGHDQAFWNAQCEQRFAACAGRCQAEFEGANGCHAGFICP